MKRIFDAIFRLIARKISYTFAAAFFSMAWSMFFSMYGFYFYYSTARYVDLKGSFAIMIFLIANCCAYLFHLFYYGFFHPFGFSGLNRSVRTVNKYMQDEYIFKNHEKLDTKEIESVFSSLTKLPTIGVITAVVAVVLVSIVTIAIYFFAFFDEFMVHPEAIPFTALQVIPYAVAASIITLLFIGFFVYNISEYFAGPYRERIGEILFHRIGNYEKKRFMSIRKKSFYTLLMILTSLLLLAFYVKRADQSVLRIMIFIAVSTITIGILIFISNASINSSLAQINAATQGLASGRSGFYFPRVSDRELITFSKNYNAAAMEINELRSELKRKVSERTEELGTAYDRLSDAYEQIHSDLLLAKTIQESLLPGDLSRIEGVRIGVQYHPMGEVGGDFYDITEIRKGYVRIFLADAMGHGVRAALVTMIIKSEYDKVKLMESPAALLGSMNNSFLDLYQSLNQYFTCIVADIDIVNNRLVYSSAGHTDQLHIHDNRLEVLPHMGKIIGIFRHGRYKSVEKEFTPHDKLLLFTDGIFEEFNNAEEPYGLQRLRRTVESMAERCVEDIQDEVMADLRRFLGDDDRIAKNDDILFIGLERNLD
ncbi:MAG: SpoIIE family protein phosphatase [Spirochaetes bacterium]|nr:SpoIIE family protein phosphatase [Spirochaetota bacterium]